MAPILAVIIGGVLAVCLGAPFAFIAVPIIRVTVAVSRGSDSPQGALLSYVLTFEPPAESKRLDAERCIVGSYRKTMLKQRANYIGAIEATNAQPEPGPQRATPRPRDRIDRPTARPRLPRPPPQCAEPPTFTLFGSSGPRPRFRWGAARSRADSAMTPRPAGTGTSARACATVPASRSAATGAPCQPRASSDDEVHAGPLGVGLSATPSAVVVGDARQSASDVHVDHHRSIARRASLPNPAIEPRPRPCHVPGVSRQGNVDPRAHYFRHQRALLPWSVAEPAATKHDDLRIGGRAKPAADPDAKIPAGFGPGRAGRLRSPVTAS